MYHRTRFRIAAVLLAVCVIATAFPCAALAAGSQTRTIHTAENIKTLAEFVANTKDGDIVEIKGICMTNDNQSNNAPWVIDKAITIRGASADASIDLRAGGIILGADVIFENLELGFANRVRNAIMANGHTLTLRNVTCSKSTNNDINLFCGGVTGLNTGAKSGSHGEIIIEDCPKMGNGNIYAGSISADGQPNQSSIPATVTMVGTSKMGEFYGCGALETPVDDNQMLNPSYQVPPPKPSTKDFPVTGDVTFNLYYTSTSMVDGATGGGKNAAVVYTSTANHYPNSGLTLKNLSSLTVGSGENLIPTAESSLVNTELVVPASSILNLTNLANLEFASLQGGGDLVLGKEQTMTINGSVSGTTGIGIGSISNEASTTAPELGHAYVRAPNSADGNFELICPSSNPNLKLVRDNAGTWTVSDKSIGADLVRDFVFTDTNITISSDQQAEFSLDVTSNSGKPLYLEFIPVDITINGRQAIRTEAQTGDGDTYYMYKDQQGYLKLLESSANTLYVTPDTDWGHADSPYTISVTVPAKYTEGNKNITCAATLTVTTSGGETPDPLPTSIAVPAAKTGLKWTGAEQTGVEEGAGYTLAGHKGAAVGSYTAVATLEPGYVWSDGTATAKDIPWRIDKADGPAAPTRLSAAAPTSPGGADGKILGVTAEMEYAPRADFSGALACTGSEVINLAPGTYFVRLRETQTHQAGAPASITVPDFNAPTVDSIRVNSTGHKTSYTVGSPLDVSGLTIEAAYSDQSTRTVPVTEHMVSGFDSSTAGSKTLTITYEGRQAAYEIEVVEAGQPDPPEEPDPSHTHDWSTVWYNNSDHHWRECRAQGCPIAGDSEKEGYGAHTAGGWITDQAATSTQPGSRHRQCTTCGYVMVREIIPATGGGSSSGGSSSGGSSSGGSSSGNVSTSTQKNPDGSTTTTKTDRNTGTVTTTTKRPDGSQTVVEAAKDGTVTTTEKAKDGSSVKTVQNPDGSSKTTVNRADKVASETSVDRRGKAESQVKVPAQVTQAAQRGDKAVLLPVPEMPVTRGGSISITIQTSSKQPVKVEVPVAQPGPGAVAVILHPNGVEEVVKTSALTPQGVLLTVSDGAVVTVRDNSKYFSDVDGHWAKDAISFASARELFQGETASTFAPNDLMSRAMLMTVLASLDGADTSSGGTWYAGGVEWAVAHGISDGSNPERAITREQLAAMLYRCAGSPRADSKTLAFSDAQSVSGYAQEAMCWAVERGLLCGYGNGLLAPKDSATRAEVAAVLKQYIGLMN